MARYSRHTLSYCALCEGNMVICADCGNNCCNGGTQEIDGVRCGCEEAYEDQTAYLEDPECVRFEKDIRDQVPHDVPFSRIRPPGGPSDQS